MKNYYRVLSAVWLCGVSNAEAQTTTLDSQREDRVLVATTRTTPGGTRIYEKILTQDGRIIGRVTDTSGNPASDISAAAEPTSDELRDVFSRDPSAAVKVAVWFSDGSIEAPVPSWGYVRGANKSTIETTDRLNGMPARRSDFDSESRRREAIFRQSLAARETLRGNALTRVADGMGWQVSPSERQAVSTGRPLVRVLHSVEVDAILKAHAPAITAIELFHEPGDDSLATAMVKTSVSAPGGILGNANSQGNGVGVWLTENCAPPNGYLSNYLKVADTCDGDHARNTSAILRAVCPGCAIYGGGQWLPFSSMLPGIGGRSPIRVLNMSTYTSNTTSGYAADDRDVDDFVLATGVTFVKSAGNNGSTTGILSTPAAALNVLTVGNYNDATMTMYPDSSYSNPTNTHNDKPEISAPGVNINAGTSSGGQGLTFTGTSQAAPHVAGIVADMMQWDATLVLRPQVVKPLMIASATDVINGGSAFDRAGNGGTDAIQARDTTQWWWWSGPNSEWANFVNNDGTPNDGKLVVNIAVSAGHYNAIGIAWLTRGTYTYSHRNDAHPIGADFDFQIVDPSGNPVGGSSSFDNPHEFYEFMATVSGTYRVEITRYANRDVAGPVHLGMAHKF